MKSIFLAVTVMASVCVAEETNIRFVNQSTEVVINLDRSLDDIKAGEVVSTQGFMVRFKSDTSDATRAVCRIERDVFKNVVSINCVPTKKTFNPFVYFFKP